jgi:hypothetical protein
MIMSPDTYCGMGGHQKSLWMIADGLGLPELEVSLCPQFTLLLAQPHRHSNPNQLCTRSSATALCMPPLFH